jgi:hypothetical protein
MVVEGCTHRRARALSKVPRSQWFALFAGLLLPTGAAAGDRGVTPLHARIDAVVGSVPSGPFTAPQAGDQEFLRRVTLDLWGMVPTAEELEAFEADAQPDKRQRLIDRLASDPLHIEYLVAALDRQLMERRPFNHVGRPEWMAWLRGQLDAQRSLVDICRSILISDGAKIADRAPVRFFLERDSDPHRITRDVARLMLGRDIQCAQCHNHPAVADYWQSDYHGLLAFIAPSFAVELVGKDAEGKEVKRSLYWERAPADTAFESVFQRGTMLRTGPRMWGGFETQPFAESLDPQPPRVVEQDVVPSPQQPLPPLPPVSRRELLADRLLAADHREFARNWANRLWAMMFGRGLVEPLDMHHSGNPAEAGPLLDVLADGLIELQYQPSAFLREIALSEVYQRSHWLPDESNRFRKLLAESVDLVAHRAAAEVLLEGRRAAAKAAQQRVDFALQSWLPLEAQRVALLAKADAAEQAVNQTPAQLAEAQQKLVQAQASLDNGRLRAKLLSGVTAPLAIAAKAAGDSPFGQAARAAQANTLPELEQAVMAATAAQQAAAAAVEQAREGLLAAKRELAGFDPRWQAADLALRSARAALATTQCEVVSADRALAHVIKQSQGMALANAQQSAEQSAIQLAGQRALAQSAVAQALPQLATAEQQLASIQSRILEKQQAVAASQQVVQSQSQAIAQLDRAIESLSGAQSLLADPSTINAARDALQSERASRSAGLTVSTADLAMLQMELQSVQSQVSAGNIAIEQARAGLVAAQAEDQRIASELAAAQGRMADLQLQQEALWREQLEQSASDLAVYPLRSMTPEQLGWSTLRSTGVFDRYVAQARQELDTATPPTAEQQQDPQWQAERKRTAVRKAIEDLRGNIDVFISLYGGAAGQPESGFFATAEQALFTANGGAIYGWAAPTAGNAAQRMLDAPDEQAAARALFRGIVGREPTAVEVEDIRGYLAARADQRAQAVQEMVWGLLASVEYRFYH